MKHKCFFYKGVFIINFFSAHNEVDSAADSLRPFKVCAGLELGIIKSVELITADRQFFLEFRECNLCNIGVAVILFITGGVIVHCFFECRCNAHIVNYKTALFVTEHTVYTGDSLHKIVPGHWLVNIHSGKGRHIKACEPHIYNDCDFKRAVVVFEFLCKLVLVVLVADYLTPFFRVVVAGSHYNRNLFRPSRAQF